MDVNSTFEKTGIKCKVLQEIIQLAKKNCVEKVILFGSRARGDFRRTSDIDIAVTGGDFARFALDVDEETSTLLEYDIVNLTSWSMGSFSGANWNHVGISYEKI